MANKKFKFYDLSDDNSFIENIEDSKKNISYSEPFQEKKNNISLEDKLEKISEQAKEFEKTISLYENDYKLNNANNQNKKNYLNDINETTLQEKNSSSTFDDNKIENFFSYKQKLDVKTNIYLKHNLVLKIQDLSKKTGDSRSLVINKLIEIALKELEIKK